MKNLGLFLGKVAYFFTRPVIGLVVNKSYRTRLLLVHNNSVLLVRPWLGDGSWMLPGGGLHSGESPVAGVLREVREETGLTISALTLKDQGLFKLAEHGISFEYQLFTASIMQPASLKPQLLEIADAVWVDKSDLGNYKLTSEVSQALEFWP